MKVTIDSVCTQQVSGGHTSYSPLGALYNMRPPTSEQLQQQQQQQQQVAKESEEKYSSTSAYLADESKLTNHHLPSADQRTAPCIPQSPEASSSGVGHSPVHGASCVGLKCKSLPPQPPECFQLEIGLKRPAASRDMAAGHQLQSSVAGVQHSHTPRCCQFARVSFFRVRCHQGDPCGCVHCHCGLRSRDASCSQ